MKRLSGDNSRLPGEVLPPVIKFRNYSYNPLGSDDAYVYAARAHAGTAGSNDSMWNAFERLQIAALETVQLATRTYTRGLFDNEQA